MRGGINEKENRIRFWKEGMAVKYLYGMHIGYKDYLKFLLLSLAGVMK